MMHLFKNNKKLSATDNLSLEPFNKSLVNTTAFYICINKRSICLAIMKTKKISPTNGLNSKPFNRMVLTKPLDHIIFCYYVYIIIYRNIDVLFANGLQPKWMIRGT
jgi:hypothetical protein